MTNTNSNYSAPHPPADIAALLERHRAFWHRSETDRPLLHVEPAQPFKPSSLILKDGSQLVEGRIEPGTIDTLATLDYRRPRALNAEDEICGWEPYDISWNEAILGCSLQRNPLGGVWAEPLLHNWEEVEAFSWRESSIWLDEFLRMARELVAEAKGIYPVFSPLSRGPLDMIEAVIPNEMLYAGFYQEPKRMHKLLDRCADLYIDLAERWLAQMPLFYGGYTVRTTFGLWAPGTVIRFQEDASTNVSPAVYREFLFEVDQRIASRFDYCTFGTHSSIRHILPMLLKIPSLWTIEMAIDPVRFGGPPLLELISSLQMVQAAGKSLILSGEMKRSELEVVLKKLSPVGLCIHAFLVPE